MFVWSELNEGLRFSSNGAFCNFFFFFEFRPESAVSAVSTDTADSGRYSRFRLIQPIQAPVGRFSLNWPELEPCRCESALKKKATWHDTAGHAGNGVPRASPRPAASEVGAAPLVPRRRVRASQHFTQINHAIFDYFPIKFGYIVVAIKYY